MYYVGVKLQVMALLRIDILFGRTNNKTNIKNTSKVRSIEGLLYHIHVKMVAAHLFMYVKF